MLKRIISKIDVKSSNVVKGINLEGLRVLGKLGILQNFITKIKLMNLFIKT